MARKIDLTDKKIGRLTVIKDSGERTSKGAIKWECVCDCGNKLQVDGYSLTSGHTQSCGCLQKHKIREMSVKNLIGKQFGKLTVIEETDKRKYGGRVVWKCECDCGNIIEVPSQNLLSGLKRSCGCDREGSRLIDLKGQKFNKLIVIEYTGKNKRNEPFWKCKCDCGNEIVVRGNNLKQGIANSCGCYQKEKFQDTLKAAHKAGEEKYWLENTSLPTLDSKLYQTNTSGHKGVCWDKKSYKWRAYITFKKKNLHLGLFDTIEEAIQIRKKAEEELFHPVLERYGRLEG